MGMLILGMVIAAGFFIWLQFSLAARRYGVISAFVGELLLGLALIWYVLGRVEAVASDPETSGPVGFGAMTLGGYLMMAVTAVILFNAVSGLVVARLTREWR